MQSVLEGYKVVDFSRIFAGPDAAQTLGDLGADVIKIEDPGAGDGCRNLGVTDPAFAGFSPSFQSFNRNKRSLTLDLSNPEAREIAARLISEADVVINNFRPGTMDRFGLGYEAMSGANPGLVYCNFQAFGDRGPLAHLGANDLQLQAHSGLMSITGEPGGAPARAGSAIVDLHASMALVAAIMSALLHRSKTGRGQLVSTSLLQSSAHLMNYLYQEYWETGYVHSAMGTANHLSVPNQAFPSANGWVIIIAPTDEMWRRCATALDAPHLLGGPFETAPLRLSNRVALVAALSEVTRSLTSQEIFERLGAVKVNVAIVQDIAAAANDPQIEAIGAMMHAEIDGRARRFIAPPFTLTETPPTLRRAAPRLGEHNEEILLQMGLTGEEILGLKERGAI
ncbi:CaiB/BaiF CoA transferase family protein [Falsigemmobacter intermedius]|uniref:CaiB/BaiF CoA transferase family protein n=1 Tax=Falsigemmobacter intermedius TaxID=1553448 RepID=UPI003F1276C9